MAGFSNPYGGNTGPGGALDSRKRALLAHIMGHGTNAPNSGGRVLNPGAPFGALPHFAPNFGRVMQQHPAEQFGTTGAADPWGQSATNTIQNENAGNPGMGSLPASEDMGGTQHILGTGGTPSPYVPKPPNQFFGAGLSSGTSNLAALLSMYGIGGYRGV